MPGWTMDAQIAVTPRLMLHIVRDDLGTFGSAMQEAIPIPGGVLRVFYWRAPDGEVASMSADIALDVRVAIAAAAIAKVYAAGVKLVQRRPPTPTRRPR